MHILDAAGESIKPKADDPPTAVKILRAEKRLQALDFWVRNPDYLANELLNQYQATNDASLLTTASQIMAGNEPDLRRLGMLRFFFGAFDRVHDAIATLKTLGLADVRMRTKGEPLRLDRRDYYLLQAGADKAAELGQDEVLRWYAERAAIVAEVAGKRSGAQLKSAQYGVERYENTRWGEIIAPITEDVRRRLEQAQASAR